MLIECLSVCINIDHRNLKPQMTFEQSRGTKTYMMGAGIRQVNAVGTWYNLTCCLLPLGCGND